MGLAIAATAILMVAQGLGAGATTRHTIEAAGLKRIYYVHLPTGTSPGATPLMFVFHGSGDNGLGMESFSKFSAWADREGFIAVYPDAISQNWNDGREASAISSQFHKVDDVAFVDAMIRRMEAEHSIDTKRIYAAGFSNGGIFVHYLASHLSAALAAIADVSGGIAEPFAPKFNPTSSLSVFMIHGTKDPMVPYGGGDVDFGGFGRIIDTKETVRRWTECLHAKDSPQSGSLDDINTQDSSQTHWTRWTGAAEGCELLLYTIEGGGHTWPGGPQFLPVDYIGHVNLDFDATEAIGEFFKKHPKPKS
jgi:polyhydroxybutyrate depolymerase